MTANRIRRAPVSIVLLSTLVVANACTSYQPLRGPHPEPRSQTRIQSGAPLSVFSQPTPGAPLAVWCSASLVEGKFSRTAGDTASFHRLTRIESPSVGYGGCAVPPGEAIVVFLPGAAAPRVTERRFSAVRTAILVVGIGSVVGLIQHELCTEAGILC